MKMKTKSAEHVGYVFVFAGRTNSFLLIGIDSLMFGSIKSRLTNATPTGGS